MKYRHKIKLQEAAKVKGQKRRVADRSERPQYTDEEVAKLVDYDYHHLLDMVYYKLDRMQNYFLSNQAHTASAKKKAKQMAVAMKLIDIVNGRDYFDRDEEPYINMNNFSRFGDFHSPFTLRKEKAWHVLFRYLESRMKGWWD